MSAVRKNRKKTGIRAQVMIGFMIFTAVIVCMLWFFQIGLLNTFYKAIKINEIRAVSNQVVEMLENGASMSDYVEITHRTGVSMLVTDPNGTNISMTPNAQGSALERLSRLECRILYLQVQQAGGSVLEDNITEPRGEATYAGSEPLPGILYARTVYLEEGEFLVVLFSTVVPVDAAVQTLKIQLWCLTFGMLFIGLILALFIAWKLSSPLEQINASAKHLAAGNYAIRFPETGNREAAELAGTLNYAAAELSKVEDLRRELIDNVSHDLRTPLTMISGYAEVMRDLPGENTPENVQVILEESNRLTGLVNDMLDLSRIQAGVTVLSAEVYNLTEEIRRTLTRYDKLAEYQFVFTCTEDVFVYADRLKISQVVYNLVNNAINYAGADKTVYLRQTTANGTVRVEITDTGAGIPAEQLPYIWERYYKVDKAHRRAQVGTGLGLSIVKNILDLHGGRYGVQSVEGHGSTFWFELPVYPVQAVHPEEMRRE